MNMLILLKAAALHIPDGFLSVQVALLGWLIAVLVLTYTLKQTRHLLGERQIPILGVLAAFVFAAQTINFPVLGGTSGHLLGAALVAIVVGPWPAVLVMTVVVGLQALLFQDGGVLAMGWNIVNMAMLAVFAGSLTYGLLRRILGSGRSSLVVATMVAAWLSVVLSATATGIELAASDSGLLVAIPAMAGVHAAIGIGEALISAAALVLIIRSRPQLIDQAVNNSDLRSAYVIAIGLVIVLIVAGISVISSPQPDGLERVAFDLGFANRVVDPIISILPDYKAPFMAGGVAGAVGGIIVVAGGTILAFLMVFLSARLVRRLGSRHLSAREKSRISSTGD